MLSFFFFFGRMRKQSIKSLGNHAHNPGPSTKKSLKQHFLENIQGPTTLIWDHLRVFIDSRLKISLYRFWFGKFIYMKMFDSEILILVNSFLLRFKIHFIQWKRCGLTLKAGLVVKADNYHLHVYPEWMCITVDQPHGSFVCLLYLIQLSQLPWLDRV